VSFHEPRYPTHEESPDLWLVVVEYQCEGHDEPRPQTKQPRKEPEKRPQSRQVAERLCANEPYKRVVLKRFEDVFLGGVKVVWNTGICWIQCVVFEFWVSGKVMDSDWWSESLVSMGSSVSFGGRTVGKSPSQRPTADISNISSPHSRPSLAA
jgi:hypothetical protein